MTAPRRSPLLLYALFFASGAAALVYEVSWSRRIGLLFGQSEHTAAVVLGSYFAGMAIGYALAARWADRVSPLIGYGAAELLAAGWAALVPTLLDAVDLHAPAVLVDHPSLGVRMASRAAIGFLALLPATIALGATLPFMAQALAEGRRDGPARVATAYAMNTLGALVGVVAATAVLLVFVGVRGSAYLAAAISAACGLIAVGIGLNRGRGPVSEDSETSEPGLFWPLIAAASGFGTLALEVLYNRMFALVFHNSTYSFGIIVALFLLGLAIGSAVVGRIRGNPARIAGWASLIGAALTAASLLIFSRATGFRYFHIDGSRGFVMYALGVAIISGAVVLPPIVALGVVLPATWRAAGASGRSVGRLTAANTLAAAAGSLAASFLLAPSLGLWGAFGLVAGVSALVGIALLWKGGLRIVPGVAGACVALAIVGSVLHIRGISMAPPGSDVLMRMEGPYGLIDVTRERETGKLTIRQNLHYGLGSSLAAGRELAQGHLPLVLHPDPEDVLFLGVGTGVTAASALAHPEVKRVVAVELNPDVVQAARRYFGAVNRRVLDDPRVTVVIDDARHYLARTDRRFDVIVSDLFVPWESRTGYLYTVEHYREARKKLKPGGFLCQWLALYQVGESEFEAIADSMASVFPTVTLWWGQVDASLGFVALIGSEGPIVFDEEKIASRLEALHRYPEEAGEYVLQSVPDLLKHFNGEWAVRHPDRLNTDEHPIVEFLAPITQTEDRLLRWGVLVRYERRVLSKLPRRGLRRMGEPPG